MAEADGIRSAPDDTDDETRVPGSDWEFEIGSRGLGVALVTVFALLAITACAAERPIVWAAGRVLLPAFVLGLVPGLLLAVVCRRGARWGITELLGVAIALSLGLAQVPTLIGIGLSLPTTGVVMGYATILVAGSLALCLRNRPLCRLSASRGELLVLGAIVAVACVGYAKGSPFFCDEEQIHIAVIRRLAVLPAPAPANICPVEGNVYTDPFPGTHYFITMVTALGRGDALFVYHKLRCCWIFATFVFLYALARRIFGDRTVAAISVFCGIAFILNGSYADFWVLFGGQLAPFSHPSDIAMAVLLPGLLLVALRYYDAATRRDTLFFFGAAVVVAGMLTMVHIRETVQFLVYSACLLLVTCAVHWKRARVTRILTLVAVIVAMAVCYGLVHHRLVQHVANYDSAAKRELIESLRTGTFSSLIGTPFPFHENTLLFLLFYGWYPVLILGSPLVCLAYRRRPLVLMMGTSILAYLVIIRLPVLSILYTYCTHVDMMLVPVRNFSFFLYLMTGPLLYLIACQARRLPLAWLGGALAVPVALGLACTTWIEPAAWMAHYDWFFLPAIGLYVVAGTIVVSKSRWASATRSWFATESMPRTAWTAAVFAAVLVAATLGSGMWERSLLSLHHSTTYSPFLGNDVPTARSPYHLMMALRPVVTPYWELRHTNPAFADYRLTLVGNVSVPPPPRLIEWAKKELSPDAVLATNALNVYPLPVFLAQRIIAWPPIVSFNLSYPKQVSPAYYQHLDESLSQRGVQPFFNTVETLAERRDFLIRTHATHVVLDPPSYRDLRTILLQTPSAFQSVYDDGAWAVFAVHTQ
jgi:hypothetical protein